MILKANICINNFVYKIIFQYALTNIILVLVFIAFPKPQKIIINFTSFIFFLKNF